MLKEEKIKCDSLSSRSKGAIKVTEIMERLNVSDMTVRRDLTELEAAGRLKRVHGGASSLNTYRPHELSHADKQIINSVEKKKLSKSIKFNSRRRNYLSRTRNNY